MKKFKYKKLLKKMIDEKFVNVQTHPTLPLKIYNYSQTCQFEKMWNVVTLECRGLILDDEFNIVARPLKKFFNAEEVGVNKINNKMSNMNYNIFGKADGSLGICFKYNDIYGVATRGSFTSDQAIWATNFLNTNYSDVLEKLDTDKFTYLFEIIYSANTQELLKIEFDDNTIIYLSEESKIKTQRGNIMAKDLKETDYIP